MAVDIGLVLRSEHRDLQRLADRCGRRTRGFQDPVGELQRSLAAHVLAAAAQVYPSVEALSRNWPSEAMATVRRVAMAERADGHDLVEVTGRLIAAETDAVIPVLERSLDASARRRMGKMFRMRRDAALRASQAPRRGRRSQAELYELARRAGVEHRSQMTQAQLKAAIEARGISTA